MSWLSWPVAQSQPTPVYRHLLCRHVALSSLTWNGRHLLLISILRRGLEERRGLAGGEERRGLAGGEAGARGMRWGMRTRTRRIKGGRVGVGDARDKGLFVKEISPGPRFARPSHAELWPCEPGPLPTTHRPDRCPLLISIRLVCFQIPAFFSFQKPACFLKNTRCVFEKTRCFF